MIGIKLHMTDACRKRYHSVVEAIQEVLQNSDSTEPIFIAIDGDAASGKTTLGFYLQEVFACNLFHMDDFFLPAAKRSEERWEEIGGTVEYERFYEEVILPLTKGIDVIYRPFSCKSQCIGEEKIIPFQRVNVIEGSYSQHSYFGDIYQLRVFIEISPEVQEARILARNGAEKLQEFLTIWIPREKAYFEKFAIKDKSLVIKV